MEFSRKMETGFPSPAADHLENALDLEELIVQRPSATFYVRAEGNAMKSSGICDGDILVVDRSVHATNGNIVIAAVDEEPLIRRLAKKGSRFYLLSDDPKFEPIVIHHEMNWMIWGVVSWVIHRCGGENE
ncbi:MAG: translesion error-prone DNA polymerase V autoproteolytic subunit [Balneolaceae bacterium]